MDLARAGLTIRLSMSLAHKQTRGNYAQGRMGQNPCGRGYVFFGYNKSKIVARRLEHFYTAVIVIEPLQLHFGLVPKLTSSATG